MKQVEEKRGTSDPGGFGDRVALATIVVLGLVLTVVQIVIGPGLVLDDWYALRNAELDGTFHAADSGLRAARPGAAFTFGLAFGVVGDDRIGLVLFRMAVVVAVAVLCFLILRRFLPVGPSATVALVWLVLPNHMSLEFWPSALVSSVSLMAVLLGWLLMCRTPSSVWSLATACVLFAFAVLTYESNALPVAVAGLALPWLATGRPQWVQTAAVWGTLALTTLWSLTHWHSVKSARNSLSAYPDVVQAHFGWGVFPDDVAPIGVVLFSGAAVWALLRLAMPSFRGSAGAPERLVLAGLVVMVVGSVTFVLYFYAPLGAGDRVSYMSSLGGAMVMVGLLWTLWRRRQPVAALALIVVVGTTLVVRADRSRTWVTAGADADRIIEAIKGTDPSCTAIYLGPMPIQRQNVAAFLDASNVDGAVQLALGRRDVKGFMTFDEETFSQIPEGCRVDIRPLSDLEADVVVGPT